MDLLLYLSQNDHPNVKHARKRSEYSRNQQFNVGQIKGRLAHIHSSFVFGQNEIFEFL